MLTAPFPLLLVNLLRICEGARDGDVAAWRRLVLSVCAIYDDADMQCGMQELTDGGYITAQGSPRTGWLTLKGHSALVEAMAPAAAEFAPSPIERARGGVTFAEFDRATRLAYWSARLRETHGNVRKAAALARYSRTTVIDMLKRLDLNPADFQ